MVGRRRFLLLGLSGSAAALVGGTSIGAAADAPTLLPVWRLSADWGYAVPPKNRTRCRCQSCRNHAANKVFVSKAVAVANRIHQCCVCQPYSIDLLAADAQSLFDGSPTGTSIDLRNPDARAKFEAAMVRSLVPAPPPPATTSPLPPAPPASDSAAPGFTFGAPVAAHSSDPAVASDPARSAQLPVTGSDQDTFLTAASVLIVAGVAAVATASAATHSS
jgi:hypothetical protein